MGARPPVGLTKPSSTRVMSSWGTGVDDDSDHTSTSAPTMSCTVLAMEVDCSANMVPPKSRKATEMEIMYAVLRLRWRWPARLRRTTVCMRRSAPHSIDQSTPFSSADCSAWLTRDRPSTMPSRMPLRMERKSEKSRKMKASGRSVYVTNPMTTSIAESAICGADRPTSASRCIVTCTALDVWWYMSSASRSVLESARRTGMMLAMAGMTVPSTSAYTTADVCSPSGTSATSMMRKSASTTMTMTLSAAATTKPATRPGSEKAVDCTASTCASRPWRMPSARSMPYSYVFSSTSPMTSE
mmetsp:Transcript_3831/g.14205  ORF Transcript_3831/g.14205 Transcript_3831/m.14205 type:complete len:299 (-) Transcript_3831:1435-2331(-)